MRQCWDMQESTMGRSPDDDYKIRLCGDADIPSVIRVNTLTLPEHYTDDFYYQILQDYSRNVLRRREWMARSWDT